MEDVFVGSLMSSPVHTARGDTTLREVGQLLLDNGIGCVVAVDGDGRLDGIVTATDFVRIVAGRGAPDPEVAVETAMSTDVVTTTAKESVRTAADLMVETEHYHLPVVDDGDVIGVITGSDLAAYISTVRTPSPPTAE